MDSLEKALRDEFEAWIAHHPNAGLFDWKVAADNVRASVTADLTEVAVRAVRAVSEHRADPVPERHPRLEPELGCTCSGSGAMDGHAYICNLNRGV
jgi:hypothetical protein